MNEDQFLERITEDPIDADGLLRELEVLARSGAVAQAETFARMLEEALAERRRTDEALTVLQTRLSWREPNGEALERARTRARELIGDDRERLQLADYAGFDRPLPPAEAVRRLRILLRLREGVLCHDRTWGAGIVRALDPVQARVIIDFERREQHAMSLAYAAETLTILPPGHLLAQWLTDRVALERLAREQPGTVVKMALRDIGPLTADQLRDQLCPRLVPETEWKAFWETARKALKKDAEVRLPAKRNEPLTLRPPDEDPLGDAWFDTLAKTRDLDRLIEQVEAYAEAKGEAEASRAASLIERLNYLARGAAGGKRPDLIARARLCASALGIRVAGLEHPPAENPWDTALWPAAFRAMPARKLVRYLAFLDGLDPDRTRRALLDTLEQLDLGPFSAAMDFLTERGLESECFERFRVAMNQQRLGMVPMAWLLREPSRWQDRPIAPLGDIGRRALELAESPASGELLKAQKQLKERFARPEMLRDMLAAMTETQRADFIARLRLSPGWPPLDRASILGRLVRLCPEYEALVAASTVSETAAASRKLTSVRTWRERQQQLKHLIEVEIPKNSREIGVARSYGDLRENFEYKAAKDMQRILMRRRAELEQQLREAQPSEFSDAPTDRVGPGVGVEVQRADGHLERYHILGVWDRDEALHIIASESELARALMGRAVGETVTLPGDAGPAVIARIFPLPEEVRGWIAGDTTPSASSP